MGGFVPQWKVNSFSRYNWIMCLKSQECESLRKLLLILINVIVEEVIMRTRNETVKSTEAQLRDIGFSVRNKSKQSEAV